MKGRGDRSQPGTPRQGAPSSLDARVDEVTRRSVERSVEDITRKAVKQFEHCPA